MTSSSYPAIIQQKFSLFSDKNAFNVSIASLENESFGVIILESMASEKILVLSDIESYKKVALKNNYGFLYDYKSSNKLAELLLSILKNEKSSERNIKNGLKNVKNYLRNKS